VNSVYAMTCGILKVDTCEKNVLTMKLGLRPEGGERQVGRLSLGMEVT